MDPLTALLADLNDEIGGCLCAACTPDHAEWLRTNRDRLLQALGGWRVDSYSGDRYTAWAFTEDR